MPFAQSPACFVIPTSCFTGIALPGITQNAFEGFCDQAVASYLL